MKRSLILALAISVIAMIAVSLISSFSHRERKPLTEEKGRGEETVNNTIKTFTSLTETNMKITSPAFNHNEPIPPKYTCDGADINPPLLFDDIPEETKSLALIVDDPDAPAGDWVHWVLFNIPPSTREIAEDSVPDNASQGKTDFGRQGYGGPCPPSGTHRYFFKLYALDSDLNLDPATTDKKKLEKAMEGHILDKSELIGLYSRQRN